MREQRNLTQTFKSVAGSALVGPGLFILFGNVACAATECSRFLHQTASEGLSVLPSVILATSLDQRWVIQGLLGMLWPILLIIFGATLLRENTADEIRIVTANQVFEAVRVSRRLTK